MSSQNVILEALEAAVDDAISSGTLDPSVYDSMPISHVFYPEPGEPWDDDDITAIKAVGQSDVAAKIAYLSRILDTAVVR